MNPLFATSPIDRLYLTKGKRYVMLFIEYSPKLGCFTFIIEDDNGEKITCIEKECNHLKGENWLLENM